MINILKILSGYFHMANTTVEQLLKGLLVKASLEQGTCD